MMHLLQGGLAGGGAVGGSLLAGPAGAVVGLVAPFVLPRGIQAAYYSTPGRAYLTNQLGTALDTSRGAITGAELATVLAARRNRLSPPER